MSYLSRTIGWFLYFFYGEFTVCGGCQHKLSLHPLTISRRYKDVLFQRRKFYDKSIEFDKEGLVLLKIRVEFILRNLRESSLLSSCLGLIYFEKHHAKWKQVETFRLGKWLHFP